MSSVEDAICSVYKICGISCSDAKEEEAMGSDVGAELIPVCGGFQLSEFYCQHLDLKNRDPRDRGLSSIDLKKLHTVRPYWRAHRGQDHSIRVGANAFKALWHNRDKLPAVLRQYKQLYCDGDVLVNEFGVAH